MSAIGGADADQDVIDAVLRVLNANVEVAIIGEDAGIGKLVFGFVARPFFTNAQQFFVRKAPLRVFVHGLHVGVRRNVVEVVPILLNVLAVVALGTVDTVEPLFEKRVVAVPERRRETQPLMVVADA
jgi:hypothetical protein